MSSAATMQICAVVVTYKPFPSVVEHLKLLADQANRVVVVDNGSGADSEETLRRVAGVEGVELLREKSNGGLARALNVGIRHAMNDGFRWVATFDQDSRITGGYFERLEAAYNACGYRDRVVVISPIYVDECSGAQIRFGVKSNRGAAFAPVEVTMTSGNLIDASLLSATGMFDEDLFIDLIDFEFCLRSARAGCRIIEAPRAILIHNLGRSRRRSFFGRKISVSHHAADRRYYMARNRILVYRRHFAVSPRWILKDTASFLWEIVKIVRFEEDVRRKLTYSVQGLWDGLLGRTGRSQHTFRRPMR